MAMNDERMEVLRMIAEKKITVEEGERLLRALDDRERRQPPPPREQAQERERPGGFIADLLGSVGSMMQGVVSDALGGFGMVIHGRDSLAEVAFERGGVAVLPGETLELHHRGGDLDITPAQDDRFSIATGESSKVQVLRGEKRLVVVTRGNLKVQVPSTAAELKVSTAGGPLRGIGFQCPVEIRSLGGDIALVGISRRIDVKTLGGTLHLGVDGIDGDSRGETLGGDVDVEFGPGARARVHATTLGGGVRCDPALGGASRNWTMPGEKVALEIGSGGEVPAPTLDIRTMGGTVHLRRRP
jgi:hypothetical protein